MSNQTAFHLPGGVDIELTRTAPTNTAEERELAARSLTRHFRKRHANGDPADAWERLTLTSMLGLTMTPPPGRE